MTPSAETERWEVSRRALLRGAALGAGGVAAAALLGCGGEDDGAKAPDAGGATQTAAKVAAEDPRYPRDPTLPYAFNFPEPAGKTPKPGGTMVVAATWDVSTWDPTKSAAGGTITLPNLVYQRLLSFRTGPEVTPFKLEVLPELARSWERTPDGLTFTFKMQPGVKWHNVPPLNGRPFVAEDAAFALTRYSKEGVHKSYYQQVDRIETPDPSTLRFVLKAPVPEFEYPFAGRYQTIFPRELVDSGEIDKKAIGTGAMILKEALASQRVTAVRNPDYWRSKVLLDGLEYRIVLDAAARVAAFRAKQLDYGYSVVSSKRDVDELLKTIPDLQVNHPPVVNGGAFAMNNSLPKFQDVRIRRAISLALNRAEISALVYENIAVNLPILPWIWVFDKQPTEFGPWVRFDLAESKKLLQAAGQEDFTINYIYYPYGESTIRLAEVTVAQLRAAGINLKGGKVDYTEFNSQWVGAKLAEASTSGWLTVGFEANNFFYNSLHSKSPGNRWQIRDQKLDEWAEAQATELNPQKRREIHRKIWDYELEQVYRPQYPGAFAFEIYQPWLRGVRFGGLLGSNSSYYDWGMQVEGAWLDK
jgi:peptide/nickel transport system substrate-binding protein